MLVFDQLKKHDPQLQLLTLLLCGGLAVLLAGLWWVQIVNAGRYRESLEIQSFRSVRLPAVRVLYVDDDEIVSLTAAALLSREGFDVHCVRDAPSALSALREDVAGYAAVITDFNMPGMSGLALAEAVQREAPALAVILISGLVTDEVQAAARTVGVRQVVFKEDMREGLVDAVRSAVGDA